MKAEYYKKLAESRGWNRRTESIISYLTKRELFEYGKCIGYEDARNE